MFKIIIYTWGETKSLEFKSLVLQYEKYLKNDVKLIWEIFETRQKSKDDKKGQARLIEDLDKILEKYSEAILLCEGGLEYDSVEFAKFIESKSELVFVIGEGFGFTKEMKAKFKNKLSLSKMTFPHEMTRMILLEQIFRGISILRGKEYHY